MKQSEFTKCACCGKGMAATGVNFYRVTVEHLILNPAAIKRAHGMEMAFGGAVAGALGLDEDLSVSVDNTGPLLVCGLCGIGGTVPVGLLMDANRGDKT